MWADLGFPEEVIIHKALEASGGIHKAKGHDIELEGTLMGHEGSFPFVSLVHMDLVVTGLRSNLENHLAPLMQSMS
jgi:ABC-type taurine transport system substrate-binding protein